MRIISIAACIYVILISSCATVNHPNITLVDIGLLDRTGIGKELRVINSHHPKAIVFNFILDYDSAGIDSILVTEIAKNPNFISSRELKDRQDFFNLWNNVIESHAKFNTQHSGFSNVSITEDSVLIPWLPMHQLTSKGNISALSYTTAELTFGVKEEYSSRSIKEYRFKPRKFLQSFRVISIDNLFAGNFNSEDINNKIVILGEISTADFFYLNKRRTKRITGSALQACFIDQIMKH